LTLNPRLVGVQNSTYQYNTMEELTETRKPTHQIHQRAILTHEGNAPSYCPFRVGACLWDLWQALLVQARYSL